MSRILATEPKILDTPEAPRRDKAEGLCGTCNNAFTCTFPTDPRYPVRQCDELDYPPGCEEQTVSPERPLRGLKAKPAPESQKSEPVLAGLCRNCDHRSDCVFPKPEGGVWNCEEYA